MKNYSEIESLLISKPPTTITHCHSNRNCVICKKSDAKHQMKVQYISCLCFRPKKWVSYFFLLSFLIFNIGSIYFRNGIRNSKCSYQAKVSYCAASETYHFYEKGVHKGLFIKSYFSKSINNQLNSIFC